MAVRVPVPDRLRPLALAALVPSLLAAACNEQIRLTYLPDELAFAGYVRTANSCFGSTDAYHLIRLVGEERGPRDWYLRARYEDYQIIPDLWIKVPNPTAGPCAVPQDCQAILVIWLPAAVRLKRASGTMTFALRPDGAEVRGDLLFEKVGPEGESEYAVDVDLRGVVLRKCELSELLAEISNSTPDWLRLDLLEWKSASGIE